MVLQYSSKRGRVSRTVMNPFVQAFAKGQKLMLLVFNLLSVALCKKRRNTAMFAKFEYSNLANTSTLPHVAFAQNVYHIEYFLFRLLLRFLSEKKSRIDGAFRVYLTSPHVMLKFERHTPILRIQVIGVVSMTAQMLLRNAQPVLLFRRVANLGDVRLQRRFEWFKDPSLALLPCQTGFSSIHICQRGRAANKRGYYLHI